MRLVICWAGISGYLAACWRAMAARRGITLKVITFDTIGGATRLSAAISPKDSIATSSLKRISIMSGMWPIWWRRLSRTWWFSAGGLSRPLVGCRFIL